MNNIIVPNMAGRQLRTDGHWSVDGLVFFPDFSGDTGNLPDLSPYGNNGVITGAEWAGEGLLFNDGSSQYVEIPKAVVTDYPFTIICWFNSDDAANAQTLVSIADTGSTSVKCRLVAAGNRAGDTLLAQNIGQFAETTTGYTVGKWHQAVGVFVSATDRRVYIDAGSIGTDSGNQTLAGLNVTGIGRDSDQTPGAYMSGRMRHVFIYNRALSASEIQALYINPELPVAQDPIWQMYSQAVGGIVPIIQAHTRRRRAG